ncbi:Dihydropteroate synthase-like protein [Syncephalis plumigaleata]|nr:Dihydropteroate synthase-like protein [Syncephalis plumigaleata]
MDFSLPEEDWIMVEDLRVHAILGRDGWERSPTQPVVISLAAQVSVSSAGVSDRLVDTVSYSEVSKVAQRFTEASSYRSMEALGNALAHLLLKRYKIHRIRVRIEKPRALLHAEAAGIQIERVLSDFMPTDNEDTASLGRLTTMDQPSKEGEEGNAPLSVTTTTTTTATTTTTTRPQVAIYRPNDQIFVKALRISTIIGINHWERLHKQVILVHLRVHPDARQRYTSASTVSPVYNFRTIVLTITQLLEESKFKTVEALVSTVARICIERCHVPKITVLTEKPSALRFARAAAVQITRSRDDYDDLAAIPLEMDGYTATEPHQQRQRSHIVYLAMGSNLGHRLKAIQDALSLVVSYGDAQIMDTSFLYETKPMYVEDQPMFLNATCKIRTSLSPKDLLTVLKRIEAELGRDFNTIRNGPRVIDLDILFYDNITLDTPDLVIPHPRLAEREFVLRPLCDIAPHREHPTLYRTNEQLLGQLMHSEDTGQPIAPTAMMAIPLGQETLWLRGQRTCIMGILNVTPDSFSDGGQYNTTEAAVEHAIAMHKSGADIIDMGGMSTRPGSDEIPVETELARILPVIEALHAQKFTERCSISVDTYRAEVAERAILAGAHIINDVSGGELDPNMYATAAKLGVPICLMHMRGTPATMESMTDYDPDRWMEQMIEELAERVKNAMSAGIYRWNIIIDPGLGFAKTFMHNFGLLRRLPELTTPGSYLARFPVLVGPSRKAFIGRVSGEVDAQKRTWGTAAACTAAIAGKADIIRVHDVDEMQQTIKVADAVWRTDTMKL